MGALCAAAKQLLADAAAVAALWGLEPQLHMPLLARVIPALRLLPVSVQDAILQVTGFSGSMDGFRARR